MKLLVLTHPSAAPSEETYLLIEKHGIELTISDQN